MNVGSRLFNSPLLFDLETVELLDLPRIELKDGDHYKDSLSLSTGQKCTAILPILLLDSDNPLLVDQPEDNLDNRFIFEAVVDSIRKVKTRRQMIFVTHNPNIPVLGDAERVFRHIRTYLSPTFPALRGEKHDSSTSKMRVLWPVDASREGRIDPIDLQLSGDADRRLAWVRPRQLRERGPDLHDDAPQRRRRPDWRSQGDRGPRPWTLGRWKVLGEGRHVNPADDLWRKPGILVPDERDVDLI